MLLAESLLGSSSAVDTAFIEDVFSTRLYTGNGGTQTITNGIDLAGRGGLVWIKNRENDGSGAHGLWDTARGAGTSGLPANNRALSTNLIDGQGLSNFISERGATEADYVSAFTSNGFTLFSNTLENPIPIANGSSRSYVSWTFRKQPRFFDIVTYTGNGGASQTIAHSLGSVPGCIIVKRFDVSNAWSVYHRSLTNTDYMILNSSAMVVTGSDRWNNTTPTDTVFSVGSGAAVNASGGTYVAYLFAHNAGGFGATGTDNVISCGSYTGNGSTTGPVVTLGYEPQWLLIKRVNNSPDDWNLIDNMRGFPVGAGDAELNPNLVAAESTGTFVAPTATGFQLNTTDVAYNASGSNYIYIAIRRGPMRTPTTGTSVFAPVARAGTGAPGTVTAGVNPDLVFNARRNNSTAIKPWYDKLRGATRYITSTGTGAELSDGPNFDLTGWTNTGYNIGFNAGDYFNQSGGTYIDYVVQRAPGFFDVVCYTGTGANATQAHNLGVAPELMIVKSRSSTNPWQVYSSALLNTEYLVLNTTAAKATGATRWNSTTPTNSVFSLGTASEVNTNNATYVAYLFASCPGVSKVGSYTGTGATQVINCDFAAGARFVLIKRTDSTGDWYVWDSARGIVAGNDPYLRLNSTAAEVTNTDWVDTAASGFELSAAVGNLANTSGGSYIFLAIA